MQPREILDENRSRVEEAIAAGMSAAKIGATVGVTRNSVISWARDRKVQLSPPSVEASHKTRKKNTVLRGIQRLRAEGEIVVARFREASDAERMIAVLAGKYDVAKNAVRTFLRQRGFNVAPGLISDKPKKATALPQLPAPPARNGVPLLDAAFDQCRYPLWNLDDTSGFVCGEPVVVKEQDGVKHTLSWCAECYGRVFVPMKKRKAFNPSDTASRASQRL